jgi:signal transduction histidine kinase
MQQMDRIKHVPVTGPSETSETSERRRVEAVVETLAMVGSRGETLAEVAHDTRNMVTALGLYCDLLEEPGVLAPPFSHYASELRLVAGASRRLVEKLVALDAQSSSATELPAIEEEPEEWPATFGNNLLARRRTVARPVEPSGLDAQTAGHIRNLAAELVANRNLLSALAGPAVALTVEAEGGALPVRLTAEDLTRILVNMVKNAAEAMGGKGRIEIKLAQQNSPERLTLSIEDNGPGIPEKALEKVFESGYTSHKTGPGRAGHTPWTSTHRGLGLAITRSILEAAGGSIHVAHRTTRGAKFEIELPVSAAR